MTSRSPSPALSNLPLPLISLTHPGMWQVERFTVMQLKFIQPFFSITAGNGERKKRERRRFTVGAAQWTAEKTGAAPYGRNQREARPSAFSSCLTSMHLEQTAAPSSGLFYVIVLWLSACKEKEKCRTPCSGVSRLWGTAELSCKALDLRTVSGVGIISELQRAPVPFTFSKINMFLVCQWTEKYENPLLYHSTFHSAGWKSALCNVIKCWYASLKCPPGETTDRLWLPCWSKNVNESESGSNMVHLGSVNSCWWFKNNFMDYEESGNDAHLNVLPESTGSYVPSIWPDPSRRCCVPMPALSCEQINNWKPPGKESIKSSFYWEFREEK